MIYLSTIRQRKSIFSFLYIGWDDNYKGNPRLCLWTLNVQRTGGKNGGRKKFKPQRMGMQVPYRVDTEMQAEMSVWADSQVFRGKYSMS